MLPGYRKIDLSNDPLDVGPLGELLVVQISRQDLILAQAFAVTTERENLRLGGITSLALIVANPGISQNEIGRTIGIDKSAVVQIVDELEGSGYVLREKSRQDRRRYALRATPQGVVRLESLVAAVRKIENEMLANVSDTEIQAFQILLNRLFRSCRELGPPLVRTRPGAAEKAA